jgi:hypothetical protein
MKLILFIAAIVLLTGAFAISFVNCNKENTPTLSEYSRVCDFSWILLSIALFISTFWMFRFCPNAWAITIGFLALIALITIKVNQHRMTYLHILFVCLSFIATIIFLIVGKMSAMVAVYGVLLVSFLVGIFLKDNGMTITVEYLSFVVNLYVVFFLIPEGKCVFPGAGDVGK